MSKYSINKPFIFYVGSDVGRKNIKRLAKSFNSIEKQIPHELILAGNIRRQYNSQRIKKIGYVNNEDLVQLYNQADLYVYPSLYEGFGLPILEAQACGCPVLTSNVTSMPEVAGYGAHIVNPYSEKEIAEGMEKILNDKKYREELIKKGFENVKRFSWEKTARDILKVCKDLSKNPRRS
ncbi:MAG: glycosyltransferase family 4 protein [Candidatus Woesearchaeota archaeon]